MYSFYKLKFNEKENSHNKLSARLFIYGGTFWWSNSSIISGVNNELCLFKLKFNENDVEEVDVEKLKFPLTLRKWKQGDKFMPLGMKKFKKLSDFFIDSKFSIINKQEGSGNNWANGFFNHGPSIENNVITVE